MKRIIKVEQSYLETPEDYKMMVDVFCNERISPSKLFSVLSAPDITYIKFTGCLDSYLQCAEKYFLFGKVAIFKFTVTQHATLDDAGQIIAYTADKSSGSDFEYAINQNEGLQPGEIIVEALIVDEK